MILEYTAHAAAAEVRSLAATAASADHLGAVRDRVARQLRRALGPPHVGRARADGVAVSAELVLAVRALRLRGREPAGPGLGALFAAAGASLDPDMADRPLSGDLEAARLLLFDDALWMAAEPSTDA
jgi:histidine ammonia-lyase